MTPGFRPLAKIYKYKDGKQEAYLISERFNPKKSQVPCEQYERVKIKL